MSRPTAPTPQRIEVDKLADLAQGGMGVIEIGQVRTGHLAGQVVAVKRLHAEFARDPDVVSMFLDEAWLTSAIRSPHVARVEAFGQDERGLFLVCELVRGISLGRLQAEARAAGQPFSEPLVAAIGVQLCAGLAAAHELRDEAGNALGLVHRDLTPGNVLIGFDGTVKIADFGIAKAARRVTAQTRAGIMKGKPSYVAPEQVRGGAIDGRADLFSLGIVLFELLAGRRPWSGRDDTDLLVNMMRTDAPSLAHAVPTAAPELVHLVDACLRKPVDARPASARALLAGLDAFRARLEPTSCSPAAIASFAGALAASFASWFEQALAGKLTAGGESLAQVQDQADRTRVQVRTPAELPAASPVAPPGDVPARAGGATILLPQGAPMPPSRPLGGTMLLAGDQAASSRNIAPSSGAQSSAPATPPPSSPHRLQQTEWLQTPPSSGQALPVSSAEPAPFSAQPVSSSPRMSQELHALGAIAREARPADAAPPSFPGRASLATPPPTARSVSNTRGGPSTGKVVAVFLSVFLLSVVIVSLVLRGR